MYTCELKFNYTIIPVLSIKNVLSSWKSTKTFELNKMAVYCFHFTTLSSKGSRNIQNHLNLLLDPKDCR